MQRCRPSRRCGRLDQHVQPAQGVGATQIGRRLLLRQVLEQQPLPVRHRDHHHCTFLTDREVEIYDGVDYEGFSYYQISVA